MFLVQLVSWATNHTPPPSHVEMTSWHWYWLYAYKTDMCKDMQRQIWNRRQTCRAKMASPTRSAMIICLKRNGGRGEEEAPLRRKRSRLRDLQFRADFALRKCKFVFVLAVEKLFMAIKLCLGDNCAWLGLPKARPANLWLKAKVICRTPFLHLYPLSLPPHCATVGSAVMTRVSSMSVLSISGTVPKSMGKWNFLCLFLFLFSRLPFRVHFVLLHSSHFPLLLLV